ncbi:hypothetical protein ACP70R_005084 [Stipagrostis hirtigluma subsp. patula]
MWSPLLVSYYPQQCRSTDPLSLDLPLSIRCFGRLYPHRRAIAQRSMRKKGGGGKWKTQHRAVDQSLKSAECSDLTVSSPISPSRQAQPLVRWMSNKRKGQGYRDQRGGGNKKSRRRKHLYVVLDDWNKGFSIHKIDADDFHSDSSEQQDWQLAVLAIGPHAPAQMVCGFGITVPVGEVLYALSYRFFDKEHSVEAMSWAPTAPDAMQHPTEGWSWKTLPAPPPSFTSDRRVTSYALHPDGCTIFMTTAHRHTPGNQLGTYSFNTKDSVWKWLGGWALPFHGQGYFDSELDAWVGLHQDGYICSCQVASTTCSTSSDYQMTKEKLFCKDPEAHKRATLTYMGRSKYCLVESVAREGVEYEHALGDHHGCVLHLTIFGLRYNHKGELRTTGHKSTRSYLVSRHNNNFSPVAFWM